VVSASYRVHGKQISFRLGTYDSSKSLVIDPRLAWGTFLDGGVYDVYNGFRVDSDGFTYIVGETGSPDFPVTPGAYQKYQTQNSAGEVFVSKLSQDGSSLVWSTIVGGTGPDNASWPNGFTLDSQGNVYIVGTTGDFTYDNNGNLIPYVSTFPTTPGAYDRTELAGWHEFLVKVNSTGSALDFSTFLSDQPNIIPFDVVVGTAGNVYVTGASDGVGIGSDYATIKYNSTGQQQWVARYSGFGGYGNDEAYAIAVDHSGNVYVTGRSPGAGSAEDYAAIKYNSAGQE